MPSDIKLNENTVAVEGNLGIGTANPARQLHVEGNEIHSGGSGAGFSFSDRKKSFVNSPHQGERWVWYAQDGVAHLWSGENVLTISKLNGTIVTTTVQAKSGSFPEGLSATVTQLRGKENRVLCTAEALALNHPSAPTKMVVEDDTMRVRGSVVGAAVARAESDPFPQPGPGPMPDLPTQVPIPPRLALFHEYGNGKDALVLNQSQRYTQGVRIEGNLHVNGALTHASSIALKENVTMLSIQEAMSALQRLQPVTFSYKADEQKEMHAGFIAEDVPDLVAKSNHQAIGSMDVVAVLTAVVQEQQRTIAKLAARVERLLHGAVQESDGFQGVEGE
jgi:hypothetical protein